MQAIPLSSPRGFIAPRVFFPYPDPNLPSQPSTNTAHSHPHQTALHRQQQQRRDEERKAWNAHSPLALLSADEAAIAQRKAAIRDFGSFWLRPPGVGKTLQAMREEEAERLEQEELNRQEAGLRDMQAVQEQADARAQAEETAAHQEEGQDEEMGEERDLDDDIPEAEGEVSFNEESLVEDGSQLEEVEDEQMAEVEAEMEEAELIGVPQDEEALGIEHERNLDDSIPEAGSYEHTDTELEDSSDTESEMNDSMVERSGARRAAQIAGNGLGRGASLQDRMRAQVGTAEALPRSPGDMDLGSSLVESSFVTSSPVMQRGGHAGRGRSVRGRRAGRWS